METNSVMTALYNALPLLLKGLILTMQVTFFAMLVGFSIGLILGILSSNRLKKPLISNAIMLYVTIIRGTPIYVQILIVYYALPDLLGINLSPLIAGILALGCNSIAYVTEIIRGGINSVPVGQWEACHVLGYSFIKTLITIIIPQMLKNNIPSLTSELTTLLKETSILGTIGLLELTKVGSNLNARILQPMPIYLTIALFYLILIISMTILSKIIEKGLQYD